MTNKSTPTVRELIAELQAIDESKKDLPVFAFISDEAEVSVDDILNINCIDDTLTDRIDLNLR